jgi:hypothetical protein
VKTFEPDTVDERDSSWEDSDPRFRVYLFEKAQGFYATRTYDITGADVLEAIAWAQQKLRGEEGSIAVALVGSHHFGKPGRGLVWVLGGDLVCADERTLHEADRAALAKMRERGSRPLNHDP